MIVLAAAPPVSNSVVPGVLGFLVVAAMGFALFFLLRSLNKQLHKVADGPRWRGKDRSSPRTGQGADQEAARPGPSTRP